MSNADDLLLGPDEPIPWPTRTLRKEQDRAPAAGAPQHVTLAEILAELSGLGYTTEFCVDSDGRLRCRACGVCDEPRNTLH